MVKRDENIKSRFGFGILLIVTLIAIIVISSSFGFTLFGLGNNSNTSTSASNSEAVSASSTLNENKDAIANAYTCLENNVKNASVSFQEAIFSTLALGNKANLIKVIDDNKKANDDCWPKEGCKLKETAQAALAYERAGKNTDNVEKWLLGKNASMNELSWFLEIDISNHIPSSCSIRYLNVERKISIGEDMKISGDGGSCLSVSSNGFWLQIKEICYDKKFEISCDQDFITALLYTKKNGDKVYVSSKTSSAASLGTTTEEINARCFKSGTACDYEGSLWAVIALQKTGNDVSNFVPYLIALAEDNRKYFPSAFIYHISGGDEYYTDIIQSQKQGKYWEIIGTPYSRFYDTSLGMLALSSGAAELDNAKNYLLNIQGKDGCWNSGNIRDTAFLLYSGWSKVAGGSGTGTGSVPQCSSVGYCEARFDCLNAQGNVLDNYQCQGLLSCCSVNVQEQSCEQKGGLVCSSNQQCDGLVEPAADGSCCLGRVCKDVQVAQTCEGICQFSCDDNQESGTGTCSNAEVCCIPKAVKSGSLWWLWLLIILILIVVLAIVFKDRLRVWWFKYKGKAKTSPVNKPRGPPSGMPIQLRPRPMNVFGRPPIMPRPIFRPVQTGPKNIRDTEMEETLKKLKEMSK